MGWSAKRSSGVAGGDNSSLLSFGVESGKVKTVSLVSIVFELLDGVSMPEWSLLVGESIVELVPEVGRVMLRGAKELKENK